MSIPAISVLLCNYNHSAYLKQCLEGVLRQTFKDFEIVLTDDGSTDESHEIIKTYAARDPRIKANFFEKNHGILAAYDDVCKRARGEHLFGQGADDFIVNAEFFATAMKAMKAHPTAAGFFGIAGILSGERSQVTGMMGAAPEEGFIAPLPFYRGFLRGEIFVPGSSSIWRSDLVKAFGGYDCAFGAQTDFIVDHALPSLHGIVYSRVAMTCQRVFESGANYGSKGTLWDAAARYAKVEERLRSVGPKYPEMEADWRGWRARWMTDAMQKCMPVSRPLSNQPTIEI